MSDQPLVVNRIAAVVTPGEPYLAWARRLDDDDGPSIDEVPSDELTSVYLIEESEEAEHSLGRHWESIFDEILSSWCDDEEQWPGKRTFAMFQEWFDTRLIELVFDLSDGPLIHEDA